jgi:hypothetical protein
LVTEVAVLLDDAAVLRLVIVVVTPEAAGRIHVADVVRIRPPRDIHLREDVPIEQPLRRIDRAFQIRCDGFPFPR